MDEFVIKHGMSLPMFLW